LLLFLLTRFAGQFFLFSCVMVVRFGHEGFLVAENLNRTLLHNWTVGGTMCGLLRLETAAIIGAGRCALRCPLGHGASPTAV
jgi:hypothetical protein